MSESLQSWLIVGGITAWIFAAIWRATSVYLEGWPTVLSVLAVLGLTGLCWIALFYLLLPALRGGALF